MITPVLADGTGIIISKEKPEDGATDVSILLSELSFQLNESQNNSMDYTVETNPDIGCGSDTDVSNATYSVSVTGLDWNTVYTWYVNVTNGSGWTNETFTFTTISQPDIVYVDDDYDSSTPDYGIYNFSKIQDGIDAVSEDGTVYVFNGTYQENIIVNKSIDLIGAGKYITFIRSVSIDFSPVINVSADHVKISGFTIEYGSYGIGSYGIEIYNSSNSIIIENIIKDNNGYGIYIDNQSKDNVIYHNNFNNIQNANDSGTDNIWDDGYPSGGNYWSDYTGVDYYHGPNQDILDSDGIGDTPYNITEDGSVQDRYPLINPFGENPPVADFTYTVDETTVTFTSSSYDRDGTIASYYWEFGDGKNSTEAAPLHSYDEEYTTYKVNLTVTDNDGNKDTISRNVTTRGTDEVILEIVEPKRGLYFMGSLIRKRYIRPALIIGAITIKVNVTDKGSIVKQVNFYIDPLRSFGRPVSNETEPGDDGYYTYDWVRNRPRIFFRYHIIKVEAVDNGGNPVATKTMLVKRIL